RRAAPLSSHRVRPSGWETSRTPCMAGEARPGPRCLPRAVGGTGPLFACTNASPIMLRQHFAPPVRHPPMLDRLNAVYPVRYTVLAICAVGALLSLFTLVAFGIGGFWFLLFAALCALGAWD